MKRLAGLIVSLSVLIFVLYDVDLKEAIKGFFAISYDLLILSFVINVVGAVFFNSAQIYQHSRYHIDNKDARFLEYLKVDFLIRYYSLIFPAAVTAVIRWRLFNKIGLDIFFAGILVFLNKILNLFLIIFFGGIFSVGVLDIDGYVYVFFLVLASFLIFLIVFILSGREIPFFKKIFFYVGSLDYQICKLLSGKMLKAYESFLIGVKNDGTSLITKRVLLIFIWPLLSFIFVAYSQMIVVNSFGYEFDLYSALVLRSVVLFAMMIPFSFAGIGFREVGVVAVLALYGIPAEDAIAISLVLFLFQILISFIGFLIDLKSNLLKN